MIAKRLTALAGAAVLVLAAGSAQAAPSAKALELSRRYMTALHMDNMMGTMMDNLMPTVIAQMSKESGHDVDPEVRQAITEAASEAARAVTPQMVEKMVPVIADSFTEQELQAAVSYYESPLGQSLMAKMPVYMAKMQPAMAEFMPKMQTEMFERMCSKVDCKTGKIK